MTLNSGNKIAEEIIQATTKIENDLLWYRYYVNVRTVVGERMAEEYMRKIEEGIKEIERVVAGKNSK